MGLTTPDAIDDVTESVRVNYVAFASLTVLVWDHILTFNDEIEYIWKGKKGPIIYLFILNRYFAPLGFVLNLFAYLSPVWTVNRSALFLCAHFVRYEGCTVAIAVEVVGLMMLLRISALYTEQRWITYGLAVLLIIETAVNAWLISRGEPVPHSRVSGIHECAMVFDPAISGAAAFSAWYPLLYDTIIFGLTLYRTLPPIWREEAGYILKRLFEDGLLYYSVIFSITLVLTIMIIAAPPGNKNICAQMEQLSDVPSARITVAMMSRITLNLRKAGRRAEALPLSESLFGRRRSSPRRGAILSLDAMHGSSTTGEAASRESIKFAWPDRKTQVFGQAVSSLPTAVEVDEAINLDEVPSRSAEHSIYT
ncbi:hypothetical protein BD779DRAFT_1803361 [Infundibulicybe gibba]|nr:hypothetical protein BD779DRAFT_1803361 [Infundibulicybe gibba]